MKRRVCALLFAAGLSAAGCASAPVRVDAECVGLARELEGTRRFLRTGLYVLPVELYPGSALVQAAPPDGLAIAAASRAEPALASERLALLELGTIVRVERVELPTRAVRARRPPGAPRAAVWVFFRPEDQKGDPAYVAVLRPGLRTADELLAAFEQVFVPASPLLWLERYTPEVRAAVRAKKLVPGMDAHAVELAWGKPARITVTYREGRQLAEWTWPLGERRALFRDGKLVEAMPAFE